MVSSSDPGPGSPLNLWEDSARRDPHGRSVALVRPRRPTSAMGPHSSRMARPAGPGTAASSSESTVFRLIKAGIDINEVMRPDSGRGKRGPDRANPSRRKWTLRTRGCIARGRRRPKRSASGLCGPACHDVGPQADSRRREPAADSGSGKLGAPRSRSTNLGSACRRQRAFGERRIGAKDDSPRQDRRRF